MADATARWDRGVDKALFQSAARHRIAGGLRKHRCDTLDGVCTFWIVCTLSGWCIRFLDGLHCDRALPIEYNSTNVNETRYENILKSRLLRERKSLFCFASRLRFAADLHASRSAHTDAPFCRRRAATGETYAHTYAHTYPRTTSSTYASFTVTADTQRARLKKNISSRHRQVRARRR